MAARASVVVHSGIPERVATEPEPKRCEVQQPSSQVDNTATSSSLSPRQKQLLASFGVVSSDQSQRPPEPHGHRVKCQDIPAYLIDKTLATSPFSPTFIPPHQDAPTQNQELELNMYSTFDPSKYGAPPKKQRLASSSTQKTGFDKPGARQVPVLNRAPATVQVQISSSFTHSTISEVTDHTVGIHTSPTGLSDTSKTIDMQALQPKSPNKFSVPRFDSSKYGKPGPRKSLKVAQDEANVRAATGAGQQNLKTSDPAVTIRPTVPLQMQTLASVTQPPRSPQKSLEHPSSETVPQTTAEGNNGLIQTQPPKVSHCETALKAPRTQKLSVHSQALPPKMLPSSIPPPRNPISKEEQLKQVQQAALRDIGIRNRHKGDAPETTSVRDLRIARATVSFTPPPTAVAAVSSMMDHSPAEFTSTPENTQIAQLRTRSCAPKASPSMPAAAPGISKEDHLKQVQQARLREIGMRNRGDGLFEETTSLVDLNIARTPARSDTPGVSAPVSSLTLVQATGRNTPPSTQADTATNLRNTREPQSRLAASADPNIVSKASRNPRWCSKDELKPEPNLETNSNAWGSEVPVSVASGDSLRPMHLHGRLFAGPPAGENDDDVAALAGWDGKLQPPPVDWNDRPRYNNNSSAFKNGLNNWFATAATECFGSTDRTHMFKNIPRHVISNVEWHPDGIAMTRREYTLNAHNLSKYGYEIDPADVAKYAEEVKPEDYEDWGKLDMREHDNLRFKDETTEQLVNNWLAHYANSKKTISLAVLPGHKKPNKASKVPKPEVNPHEPSVNIYIRPAVKADMQQMTDIYNWWVEKSARPAEVRPIDITDMRLRFDTSKGDDRLPFIVAILKAKKEVQRNYHNGLKVEQVVGFALATGFTAADYAEHIAAELEIYVHHKYLRQGIGRCLMDRLMCATDRGHMERGGYPFHCDSAESHWYEVGGVRNLHKLMFVARQYSRPRKDCPEEFDVTTWMKKWLVKDWDFEEEACLKQAGAKNGRFLDLTYFTKFSKWLPADGNVPGPEPRDFKKH